MTLKKLKKVAWSSVITITKDNWEIWGGEEKLTSPQIQQSL
jgi:hypothetical protein